MRGRNMASLFLCPLLAGMPVRAAIAQQTAPATSTAPAPTPAPAKLMLNSIGFLPQAAKRATITVPAQAFALVRVSDGARVFTASATGPVLNADSRQQLYTADFSAFQTPGTYRLEVEGAGTSAPFAIAANVYNNAFYVATRAMYAARCDCAVTLIYNGHTYHHDACHTEDAWLDLIDGSHTKISSTGGWHDAGDYNKYVVNAGVTVGSMFRAWEDFHDQLKDYKLDIPETGGRIPDFLAEIKWEMDWLLTMQDAEGGVYYKVTTMNFGGFIMPEKETAPRFVTPVASASTADFAAMAALAGRYYRPYDAAYADKCLAAAKKSYAWLQAHPQDLRANQAGTTTGGYGTTDPDDRLWAAAEIWETTGDAGALKDLETRIKALRTMVQANWDWGNVSNLGVFTYALSTRPARDDAVLEQVRAAIVQNADAIVKTDKAHGYNRPLGTAYSWGGNGTVARQTINLMVANRLKPNPEYGQTAADAIGYLFGRNPMGRSMVTGLGNLPPLHPHHRPSGGDGIVDPWPGYLVGGPNPGPADWHDTQDDFRTNEVAINWQGALIYALAGFVKAQP